MRAILYGVDENGIRVEIITKVFDRALPASQWAQEQHDKYMRLFNGGSPIRPTSYYVVDNS